MHSSQGIASITKSLAQHALALLARVPASSAFAEVASMSGFAVDLEGTYSLMAALTQKAQINLIRPALAWLALTGVWLGALTTGLGLLWRYESTPGAAVEPSETWPADSQLPSPANGATILLFAHPRCPCTRASLDNLVWVLDRAPAGTRVLVVLVRLPGADAGWEQSALADEVARVPRIELWPDPDGRESHRFGAETSGQTFLYDATGRLAFCGGLTAGRGMAGPNAGRNALLAGLTGDTPNLCTIAVFGCPLFTPLAACAQGCPACRN
jgi:hypothetical protein